MESNSPGQNSTVDTLDVPKTPRVIFLICFIIISLLCNMIIIIVLVHNVKLRTAQNLLIASMCAACIIDCIFNMTITMCSLLVTIELIHVAAMCKVSSFFINLVAIKKMLMLTALSADRYFSLRFAIRYEAWLSSCRIWTIIAYFWAHSIAFSIPFLTNAVSSIFRPQLSLCMVAGNSSLVFLCFNIIVCFLGPVVIIALTHLFNLRLSCKIRYTKKTEVTEKNYTEIQNGDRRRAQHSLTPSYTMVLFVLWLILEMPFLVISYIQQLEYVENAVSRTVLDAFSWQGIDTFVWLRFVFSSVFPLVTFFCKKEIWQCTKECILCRRHNSIVDIDTVGIATGMAIKNESAQKGKSAQCEKEACSKAKDRDKDNSETPSSLAFNVPVLFATSTGICIEDTSTGHNSSYSDNIASKVDTGQLKGKTLDISYHNYEYPDELMGETSDYDSSCEIDQYSSSQPVSARDVLGALRRTRSMSDPEISLHHGKTKLLNRGGDPSVTFIGDSGLDLSATSGLSLREADKSISRDAKFGRSVAGCSPVPEVVADIMGDTVCCPDACSESTTLQRKSESDEIVQPDVSISHLSTHDCPLDKVTLLDNTVDLFFVTGINNQKIKKTRTNYTNSSSGSSSPQRQGRNGTEEEISAELSVTPKSSHKLSHSKVNIARNHDIGRKGKSAHTETKQSNTTVNAMANGEEETQVMREETTK